MEFTDLWSLIISAIVLGFGGYLWVQSRKVDAVYQALFGVNGRNGMLKRLESIELETRTVDERIGESRHAINNRVQELITQLSENTERRLSELRDDIRRKR